MVENNYVDYGEKCLEFAQTEDIDFAEIYITNARTITVEIEKNSIKTAKFLYDHGIGIRCIKNGSIGFSFSTDFERENLQNMVLTAIKLCKTGIPDSDFKDLPHSCSYPQIRGMFDKALTTIDIDAAMDLCLRTANSAQIDDRISSINVDFNCGDYQRYILNTNDIKANSKGTAIQISAEIAAKENSDVSSGFEFQASRFLKEIDPEIIGNSAAEMAIKSLHTQSIETGTYPVIFHPIAVSSLFSSAIGSAVNAEAIQYQQSYLTDRIETEIASDQLNIIDNGLFSNEKGIAGLGTSKFDGEGVPHQKTVLVSAGILKSYLFDSYTAGKENRESTGNASRFSYRAVPAISVTNLQVLGNSGDLNSFISEIEKGILVWDSGDQPNLASGDFSGLISSGFKIENGAIAYPLKNAMMGINMLDFFKQIYQIGTDYKTVFNVIAPSVCVADVKIAGSD